MTDTKLKVIDGIKFPISQPYEEGMTLGAAEAKALNQTRAENIGNNTRAKIKEMKKEGISEDKISDYVAGIDAEYELTLSAVSSSRKLDPVEKEAEKIAKEYLKQALAESGRKLTVPPEGETKESWKEKVQTEVERIAEDNEVIKVAKANVAAREKNTEKLAAALDAGAGLKG